MVAGGKPVEGRARPPPYRWHEHFGFRDGISQPCLQQVFPGNGVCTAGLQYSVRGLVIPRAGQVQVDPGVIIMGYPGDPVRDDPTTKVKRPAWTEDRSILVFRKLEQSAISLWRIVCRGMDLVGANLFPEVVYLLRSANKRLKISSGHWLLGGAPIAKCPFRDNQKMALDPNLNNDFDDLIAPRNLYPHIDAKFLGSGSIVRAGLPYGDEVTDQERRDVAGRKHELPHGLLFNCYMTSLAQGFVRGMIGYARNDYWPVTSLVPQKKGQDPVIGSPLVYTPAQLEGTSPLVNSRNKVDLQLTGADGTTFEMCGFAKVTPKGVIPPPGEPNHYFISGRRGESFFVPSVSTLKSWASATTTATYKLDIVFLLDATGSMQVYIEQVQTPSCRCGDLRFGLMAFRDHPTQDSTYITCQHPFVSDVFVIKADLANLQADGGGYGPEAQCDVFACVLNAGWKDEATEVAIPITDHVGLFHPNHPLNLANSQSLHLLTLAKQRLCSQLRISPKSYPVIKVTIILDLVKIDVNKMNRVWDFSVHISFLKITPDPPHAVAQDTFDDVPHWLDNRSRGK
ncbi:hypothetical protein DFJ58DRAFT_862930 [Suillus subalutaceus]|uniref:uncharacterized protein n=1 Tax=Suillus subalutaceus TaxID=48586 RepID=UPI001B878E28|nr:uncharacterized protein DFJ58DRAFT_862930 [Suillus subalutaceus]KAG1837457.1 hypothetical protein DFJ58DRAFT_862930 [Suillus subalutaceus]